MFPSNLLTVAVAVAVVVAVVVVVLIEGNETSFYGLVVKEERNVVTVVDVGVNSVVIVIVVDGFHVKKL